MTAALAVVMGVDSEWVFDDQLEVADDAFHFPGQCAAVGVAQHDRFRAAADRGLQSFQRIG